MAEQDLYFYGGEDGSFIKTFKDKQDGLWYSLHSGPNKRMFFMALGMKTEKEAYDLIVKTSTEKRESD
jgi:hypothetical protein